MRGDLLEMQVCVHGRPCREFIHQGKIYIEGRKGSDYTLRLRNRTARPILAVVSIDGLSIADGKPATKHGDGYVVRPHETLSIPGWRLDDHEVAKFTFDKQGSAYVAKAGGDKRNIGLIGAAVYQEKVDYIQWLRGCSGTLTCFPASQPVYQCRCDTSDDSVRGSTTADAAADCIGNIETSCNVSMDLGIDRSTGPSGRGRRCGPIRQTPLGRKKRVKVSKTDLGKGADMPSEVGTKFGSRHGFRTQTVDFEKATEEPYEMLALVYDSRSGLQRRGVDLKQRPKHAKPSSKPTPFPGDVPDGCEPPDGWQG